MSVRKQLHMELKAKNKIVKSEDIKSRKKTAHIQDEIKSVQAENSPKTAKEGILDESDECAVCLQSCVHPARLPCGHVYCFLCVKGLVVQNNLCAMCREEIPPDFIDKPNLLESLADMDTTEEPEQGYRWFYEGRNGWWQYDERTCQELETVYNNGEASCSILIAGFLYFIDLQNMFQVRKNDPTKKRRIKRDMATLPKKGIAGLCTVKTTVKTLGDPNMAEVDKV